MRQQICKQKWKILKKYPKIMSETSSNCAFGHSMQWVGNKCFVKSIMIAWYAVVLAVNT